MKILYIITSGSIGGAQKYVLELAKNFNGTIAVGSEHTELLSAAKAQGIPVINLMFMRRSINPFLDFLAFWELIWVIVKSKPEIIHSNSTKAGILGSIAGKLLGKKTIFTIHGFSLIENNKGLAKIIYKFLEKFSSLFRDKIISVSNYDKQLAIENNIASHEQIITIYNGVDDINFLSREAARSGLNISESKIIIGTIARLQHLKGIDILTESIGLLPSELKEQIQVVVIGDGPDQQKIIQKIDNLKLKETVRLLGSKPEASKFLPAFDIYVSPSRYEGMPFALIEAMHSSVPIIATDVGGTKELLQGSAIMTEPNPQSLAQDIAELIRNKELQASISLAANKRAQQFTKQAMLQQTDSIYKTL